METKLGTYVTVWPKDIVIYWAFNIKLRKVLCVVNTYVILVNGKNLQLHPHKRGIRSCLLQKKVSQTNVHRAHNMKVQIAILKAKDHPGETKKANATDFKV